MSNKPEEKSALEQLEDFLKEVWRQSGQAHIIAAKHSEFVVEPLVFVGDKLNPDILKLLIINYLFSVSRQDSGMGRNIEVSPEKLVIKAPNGKPVAIVRDKQIIRQYIAARA